MTRFTLHVPEAYNDGTPVGPATFDTIEGDILAHAGGFTLTHAIGAWKGDDGATYREHVRLYAVDTAENIGPALVTLANRIGVALRQEAVYLTAADVEPRLVYPQVAA